MGDKEKGPLVATPSDLPAPSLASSPFIFPIFSSIAIIFLAKERLWDYDYLLDL